MCSFGIRNCTTDSGLILHNSFFPRGLMTTKRTPAIWCFVFCWSLLALQIGTAPSPALAADPPLKRVLYISSYHLGMPWANRIWAGIKDGFADRKDIELFIEFMDTKRLPPDRAFKSTYMAMEIKYEELPVDLIITSDDNALQFIKTYGQTLFPNIPVVFCGANEIKLDDIADFPNVVGVRETRDIEKGLSVALQLHPDTDQIFVIIDKTVSGQKMREALKEITPKFPEVTFTYPDDLNLSQLLETASRLRKGSLILYLFYARDADGIYFDSEYIVRNLIQVVRVPIYTNSDTHLGKGFVGGMITSSYYQGLEASKLASRILDGESVASLPRIQESPNKLIFDYPALVKAGVSPEQLPKESIVLNRPVSFYDKYKILIWGVLATLAALSILVILMGINIIQRKSAQRKLAAALSELQLIFDNTQAGIVLLTAERKILRSNQRMADIFGYDSPEDMVGLSSRAFHISDESFEHFAAEHLGRLKNGEKVKTEYRLKRRDDVKIWTFIAGTTMPRPALPGSNQGALFIVDDITDRKEAEMALEKLNLELEEKVQERTQELASQTLTLQAANARLKTLDKEKSAMISSVSHEMRTPLTSIRGFVKLIDKSFKKNFQPIAGYLKLNEKAETIIGNLAIIDHESDRLTRLISDFLDLAKIESGQLVWRDTDLDLDKLISQALESVRGQFAALPELSLEVDIENDLPPIHADGDRITQVLLNLLSNAVKHTVRGRVTVSARRREKGRLLVTVSDTGCGISEEHLPQIFDKFYQVKNGDTLSQQGKGTGLGLAICREIIAHYDGSIWAESQFGVGSTFFFTLPFSAPS